VRLIVCVSISRITPKQISLANFIETWCYDWAYQWEESIIFWWWSSPGYGFRITFPLPPACQNMRISIGIRESTREWIHYILGAKWQTPGSADQFGNLFSNPASLLVKATNVQRVTWRWRRYALSEYTAYVPCNPHVQPLRMWPYNYAITQNETNKVQTDKFIPFLSVQLVRNMYSRIMALGLLVGRLVPFRRSYSTGTVKCL